MDWISVDKKTPEQGQRIICAGLRGAVFIGYYVGRETGCFEFEKHVVSISKCGERRTAIEAWMPVPEPYTILKKRKEFLRIREAYYYRTRRRKQSK